MIYTVTNYWQVAKLVDTRLKLFTTIHKKYILKSLHCMIVQAIYTIENMLITSEKCNACIITVPTKQQQVT